MSEDWDNYIQVDEFFGCCAIGVIYSLGSAEGVPRAPDFKTFANQIWDSISPISVATTNHEQTCERRWLRRLGWKTVRLSKKISLHHITIDRSKEFQEKLEEELKKEKPKVSKPKVKKQKFSLRSRY